MSDRRRDRPKRRIEVRILSAVGRVGKWVLSTRVGKIVAALFVLNLVLGVYIGRWADIVTIAVAVLLVSVVLMSWLPVNVSMPMLWGGATSGRESFDVGLTDKIRTAVARPDPDAVAVNRVMKKHSEAPSYPILDRSVSLFGIGQTGTGKSTFVMAEMQAWDFDAQIIAHGISNPGEPNEFAAFLEAHDVEVVEVSSRDSDLRWDPFLDIDGSVRAIENIADGIFSSRVIKETGWSEPARSLLLAALIVTNDQHGEFAALPDVLAEGPEYIITELDGIPDATLVQASLRDLDVQARETVYSTLLNHLRPLLLSDIFDQELTRFSLQDYYQSSGGHAIVLDNVREDRYARGFWRFFLTRAIETAFATEGQQRFVLDEVDKLPAISNLDELVSAGRSANVQGLILAQDVHQLRNRYGTLHGSIWANCPNRVCFSTGDSETAELALSSLGETELHRRRKSTDWQELVGQRTRTAIEDGTPLTTSELVNLDTGEALIQSPEGWWLVDLSKPTL